MLLTNLSRRGYFFIYFFMLFLNEIALSSNKIRLFPIDYIVFLTQNNSHGLQNKKNKKVVYTICRRFTFFLILYIVYKR